MANLKQPLNIILPGVTNYEKLRSLNSNKNKIHQFNPFLSQMYSDKAAQQHEADSLDAKFLDEDIYNQLLMMGGLNTHRTGRKSSYYGLNQKAKRQQLIRLSIHDVVDEVLTKLTDEIVVQSQEKNPVQVDVNTAVFDKLNLKKSFIDEFSEYVTETFDRIEKMYGFNQHGVASSIWNKVYLFLTEGSQAYELIWDNIENPKKIIGIHEIDSLETESFWARGVKLWKHHKQLSRKDDYIILYDSQVVYVDWADASPNNRTSYLEHLLKSFNDLRIMDESMLVWTVTNSVFRLLFKIPTAGKSRIAAAQSLATEKSRYNDDIQYDSTTGELSINGSANQMMMKSYWMADGDSGTPDIQTVGRDGYDVRDIQKNEYFARKFYRAARMPYSRFDANASESWNIDTRSQLREEISFGRLVTRIQDIIKMLYLKPLYLQLAVKFPEIKNDDAILSAIEIRFNSYSVFEELMHLDVLQDKIDAIEKIKSSFITRTSDGEDMDYFSLEFLINEYLPEFTKEKLELNKKMVNDEQERGFHNQIKMWQLRAKYDPDRNLDVETGLVSKEFLDRIEQELKDKEDAKVGIEQDETDSSTATDGGEGGKEMKSKDTETDDDKDDDKDDKKIEKDE